MPSAYHDPKDGRLLEALGRVLRSNGGDSTRLESNGVSGLGVADMELLAQGLVRLATPAVGPDLREVLLEATGLLLAESPIPVPREGELTALLITAARTPYETGHRGAIRGLWRSARDGSASLRAAVLPALWAVPLRYIAREDVSAMAEAPWMYDSAPWVDDLALSARDTVGLATRALHHLSAPRVEAMIQDLVPRLKQAPQRALLGALEETDRPDFRADLLIPFLGSRYPDIRTRAMTMTGTWGASTVRA